jgi:hypothetical protein
MECKPLDTVAGACQHTKHDSDRCAILQRVRWSSFLPTLTVVAHLHLFRPNLPCRPGYGKADVHSVKSVAYNRNIRQATVKWAMNGWMVDRHKGGIWGVSLHAQSVGDWFLTSGEGCNCVAFHTPLRGDQGTVSCLLDAI